MYKLNDRRVPLREWIQLALQIGGVVTIIAGLWLATKLSPLESRLKAVETAVEDRAPLVERFIQLEERNKNLVSDVGEIKIDIKKLMIVHGVKP